MRRSHAALIAIVLFCGWSAWRCSPYAPLPPIARDLPSDFAKGERVFAARVAARYPLGSPEQFIRSDLRRQGFNIDKAHPSRGPRKWEARVSRFNGCGGTEWIIKWRADLQGRLSEVRTIYGATCL